MVFFGGFLIFFYLLRLWLAGFGGIHPDEAYYWTWSEHLSLGYFDHPPMIAWLIRLGGFIVRHIIPRTAQEAYPVFFAQMGLRLIPYFITCVGVPLIVARCIEVTQKRPLGVLQMVALASSPIFVFGPQIVTPDAPFFFGWAICLLINLMLIDQRGPEATPGDATPFDFRLAVWGGFALTFAAYSKHAAILAAFLFMVCGSGPFNAMLAGFAALLLMIPQLNWYHDVGLSQGAGILFQLKNALGDGAAPVSYRKLGDLLATQFLMWSPAVFFLVIYLTLIDIRRFFLPRKLRRPTGTLFLWAFVPLAFFSLTALRRTAEANWPLVGAIAGLVLVLSKSFDGRKALTAVVLSNFVTCLLAWLALFKPVFLADLVRGSFPVLARQLEKPSRLREFTDWDRFHTLVFEATHSDEAPILVQSYQLLSGLLFFDQALPNEAMGPRLKIWETASRKSEFNLHPEYLANPAAKNYWIIANGPATPPSGCSLSQVIYKNFGDEKPYSVLRCGN